jgi:hypothetical protein
MRNKTQFDSSLSLEPVQWADAEAVAKLINQQTSLKIKGFIGVDADLLHQMEIRNHGRGQLAKPSQRVIVRFQTKNKHPHSTKKHK